MAPEKESQPSPGGNDANDVRAVSVYGYRLAQLLRHYFSQEQSALISWTWRFMTPDTHNISMASTWLDKFFEGWLDVAKVPSDVSYDIKPLGNRILLQYPFN